MKVTSQTVEMSDGDKVELVMPDGAVITVGCGGDSSKDEPWIITQGDANERGFRLTEKGKLQEFDLL